MIGKGLTTDDAFWHCQILAAFYQLAQSVLKIGSALAERVGGVRGRWVGTQSCLTVHCGGYSCFLAQTGIENPPFTL